MTTPAPNPDPMPDQPGLFQRGVNRIPSGARNVNIPNGLPRFLGDRGTIFYAWMITMAVIGWDEWHNYHIFPRPRRLWDTSLLYGLLALMSLSDMLVPLANVFAVGYSLTTLWSYYNNAGPFGGPVDSASQPATGAAATTQPGNKTNAGVQGVQQATRNALKQYGGTHGGVQ